MITITESNMVFGPFWESQVYQIEQSQLYRRTGSRVRSVEFLKRNQRGDLWFVEAKSSSACAEGEAPEKFDTFIRKVAEKFLHALNLYFSAVTGRREGSSDLPASFRLETYDGTGITFCLVIQGHQEEWLPPIRGALERELAPFLRIWKCNVIVLNDALAKKKGLVSQVLTQERSHT